MVCHGGSWKGGAWEKRPYPPSVVGAGEQCINAYIQARSSSPPPIYTAWSPPFRECSPPPPSIQPGVSHIGNAHITPICTAWGPHIGNGFAHLRWVFSHQWTRHSWSLTDILRGSPLSCHCTCVPSCLPPKCQVNSQYCHNTSYDLGYTLLIASIWHHEHITHHTCTLDSTDWYTLCYTDSTGHNVSANIHVNNTLHVILQHTCYLSQRWACHSIWSASHMTATAQWQGTFLYHISNTLLY